MQNVTINHPMGSFWVGRDLEDDPVPRPATGRDTFHSTRPCPVALNFLAFRGLNLLSLIHVNWMYF